MNKGFSKEQSNIAKGIAVFLLLFHHVFYDYFVMGEESSQIFLMPKITGLLCKYGNVCIFIFATISGYGIAKSMEKNGYDIKETFIKREINLLMVFVPTFLVCSILYIVFNANGLNSYLTIYGLGQYSAVSVMFRVLISMFGLSKVFHMPDMNATWWYMSAAHIIIAVLPILIKIAKKHCLRIVILFLLGGYCAYIKVDYPPLSACLLASYIGFLVSDSTLFDGQFDIKGKLLIFALCIVSIFIGICLMETLSGYFVFSFLGVAFMMLSKYCLPRIACKPISIVGKNSDVIFMIHTMVVSLIDLSNNIVFGFKYAAMSYIFVLLVSIAISFLIHAILGSKPFLGLKNRMVVGLMKANGHI